MSLPADQMLISADDHLDIHAMPPDVWSSGLPKEWRERGPHVEETPDGPYWFCDGQRVSPSGRKETGFIAAHDHGFRPGQPQTRLEDMDRDGVRAQVVYGPTCTQLQVNDAALHEQVARVYNDWAAEFQRPAPDRLILLPDIPSYDPQVAKRELARCAKLGHKGAIVSSTVGRGKPLFDDDWTDFWDAAEEIGIPIHVHLSPGGLHSLTPKLGSWEMPAAVAVVPMQLDETLAGLIFSGILEKRARVKFVMGEAGLGWIPYVIERLDHELHKYGSKIQNHKLADAAQRDLRATGVHDVRGRKARRRADSTHRRQQCDVGLGLPARRQHVAALAQGAGRVAARPAWPRSPAQGDL